MTSKEAIRIIQVAISEIEWQYPMDYETAFAEAIRALSRQEASEPQRDYTTTLTVWHCGACGRRLNRKGKYCWYCGHAVKWPKD